MANQIINQSNSDDENKLVTLDENNDLENMQNNSKMALGTKIAIIVSSIVLFLWVIIVIVFSIINSKDTKIKKGVFIEGIDVSGLSIDEAKEKIQTDFLDKLDDTIYFQYGENLYSLALEQINAKYNLEEAVQDAYSVRKKRFNNI
ncbi:MAG: hypothetical protein HFJ25_02740 [Clostridia bacterium]|nr:hypothetical protein [Clostridia bacterium]